jgi:hypothetical protein
MYLLLVSTSLFLNLYVLTCLQLPDISKGHIPNSCHFLSSPLHISHILHHFIITCRDRLTTRRPTKGHRNRILLDAYDKPAQVTAEAWLKLSKALTVFTELVSCKFICVSLEKYELLIRPRN